MPNDSITRSIKRAAGTAESENYEEITYEGYGPNGVAVLVRTLSDNRNRPPGTFVIFLISLGGNLGTTGCVSFLLKKREPCLLTAKHIPMRSR